MSGAAGHGGSERPTILITGACGLVGRAVADRLLDDGVSEGANNGVNIVPTDLRSPATEKLARSHRMGTRLVWQDLTDASAVADLMERVRPDVVIHLAGIIPPLCYARSELARAVNVGVTRNIVSAAEALPAPPRLIFASSVAVYGARNPHTHQGLVTADQPTAPTDLYGALKVEAEQVIKASALDWVVLRLGGVIPVQQDRDVDSDMVLFENLLPVDGRIHTADVRDVARAFAAAATADVAGETLLIGGDATHQMRHGDVTPSITAALGLKGGMPTGRHGNPDDDTAWFATDWMDTTRAQEALAFQQNSWPDTLAAISRASGWRRYLYRVAAPLVRRYFQQRSLYNGHPGRYADPWAVISRYWGDPAPSAS